jgi:hypothetical protein
MLQTTSTQKGLGMESQVPPDQLFGDGGKKLIEEAGNMPGDGQCQNVAADKISPR